MHQVQNPLGIVTVDVGTLRTESKIIGSPPLLSEVSCTGTVRVNSLTVSFMATLAKVIRPCLNAFVILVLVRVPIMSLWWNRQTQGT